MSDYPSIERLAELQQLIADLAKVKRFPELADNGVQENDVEHSFGLALTCWYLQPKIAPGLDLLEILKHALAHDIVEVHAGDTFLYDEQAQASKNDREIAAVGTLRKDWPDFSELSDYAEMYMNKASEEARFVKAVDKFLPDIMRAELGEKDAFWNRHSVTLSMAREKKKGILVSSHVSPYYEKLLAWLDERGNIPKS